MPTVKQCLTCHEGIDEGRPQHKRVLTVYGKEPQWSHVTDISEEVRFSHKKHQDAKVQCQECHKGIEKSQGVAEKLAVDMDDCTKCHARKKVAAECSTCHTKIRKDTAPDNHRQNWKRDHGQAARSARGGASGKNCKLCHEQSTCVACHQVEPPRNHNNQWRQRGHLVTASMDRENCAVCHRTDFCDRCHRESAPRSHTASFGSPRDRHCLSCHTPVTNEQCHLCHKSTPSHLALAAPMPASPLHTAAMNCRQCHGQAPDAPLPHPDNGDTCTECHK
jgi:hypothetical protein